jgi:ergothioneine biosynthesis protein EgtB
MIEAPYTHATHLQDSFRQTRSRTTWLCRNLQKEDHVVQPMADASPPKWHLGHTTWFFEQFLLKPYLSGYQVFHEDFAFVFNSYYEAAGKRVMRTQRGNLSRPTVEDVLAYRQHVDRYMQALMEQDLQDGVWKLIELGIHHEQQHQELLVTDTQYLLGNNPLFPSAPMLEDTAPLYGHPAEAPIVIKEGIYEMGHRGEGFGFDNEFGRHKVYLQEALLEPGLVSNAQYLEFMEAGGYTDFRWWLAEGWDWVKQQTANAPLYWHYIDGKWWQYSLNGLKLLDLSAPLCHISYYEADAFARWKGMRLPLETEWEAMAEGFEWGRRWEWTGSAYLPYPVFKTPAGAIGEYNGKFMVNQMVLRGASEATPYGHSRISYRNFFHADKRWQFTGIRLASWL